MRGGMNVLGGAALGASGLAAVGTGLHYKYGLTNQRRTNLNYPERKHKIQAGKVRQTEEEKLVSESEGWEPSKEIFKIFSKDGNVLTKEEYNLYLKAIGSSDDPSNESIGYDDFRRVRYQTEELANEEFNKIDEYMLYAANDHDPGGKWERVYSLPERHPSKQYLGLKESDPLYRMKLYRRWNTFSNFYKDWIS